MAEHSQEKFQATKISAAADVNSVHASETSDNVSPIAKPGYQVRRDLKGRHVQMLALGGTIGTGLFIGSGTALQNGGPLGCLLGYFIVALVVYCVIISLCEMTTLFPVSGAFTHYAARFVDPALGFSQGFNYWWCWAVAQGLEVVAAGIIVSYWDTKTPIVVYITVFYILMLSVNLLGTRWFGESEFILSGIKVIALLGLITLGIVLILGGGPTKDRIGFRYWEQGLFAQYNNIPGSLGRFLAFWSTFINGAFSFSGSELVSVTAGEAQNPRKNIPKALKRVLFRLVFLYIGSIFVISMLVPYKSPQLAAASHEAATAAASPFVIFINNAKIPVLPHIINAVILVAVLSAANSDLYAASRTLYALALQSPAMTPRFLTKVTKRGLPINCVLVTASVGLLAYLNLSASATVVFNWLVSLSTVAVLLTWCFICVSYLRFFYACKAQGLDRNTLPYKAPFQPYAAWIGMIVTSVITLFNGFWVFLSGNWSATNFITSYIGIVIFAALYLGYKLWRKTSIIPLNKVDLVTGRMDLDIQLRPEPEKKSIWKRAYDAVL
ncbi:AAT family amino acid transporter [Protomyces lactucae-debilis]|uniref:AAT family amino acid transporter n=1 Tax=Protomyces lactucae-debilis TaxID=2754530 RepID=A0A1Y2F5K6_PROLT|nr:AAT family amino acid transporter [Protomyces lactucae-debilis]ORY78626.1 AAT family amino acid transporter [Protomyces lactucae-debilis]